MEPEQYRYHDSQAGGGSPTHNSDKSVDQLLARLREASGDGDAVLRVLEGQGYIVMHGQDVVCNIGAVCTARLRKEDINMLADELRLADEDDLSAQTSKHILMWAFRGRKVYSAEDYVRLQAGEDVSPIDLFYTPNTVDAAYSPKDIEGSAFYLLPHMVKGPSIHERVPTRDGDELSFAESTLACVIFHPDYGAGERDDKGVLYVNWSDGSRKPISSGFFDSWGLGSVGQKEKCTLWSPARFISEYAPKLESTGLIDPRRDFTIVSGSSTADRMGIDLRNVQRKGLVMIGGIKYTLGTEWESEKGYKVFQVNDKMAFIIQDSGDQPIVKAAFRLYSRDSLPDEISLRLHTSKTKHPLVRKDEAHLIRVEDFPAQSPEAAALAHNFERLMRFSSRVSHEARATIIGLTAREQSLAISLYIKYGEDERLWKFIRAFGIDGLKTLMLAVGDASVAEKLLDIGEQVPEPFGKTLFADAAGILADITRYEQDSKDHLNESEQDYLADVTQMFMTHTRHILLSSLDVQAQQSSLDTTDIVTLLRRFKRFVEDTYTKYNIVKDNNPYLALLTEHESAGPNLRHALRLKLQGDWEKAIAGEVRRGGDGGERTSRDLARFYAKEEIFAMADTTTGDTGQEIAQFGAFVSARRLNDIRKGVLVDLGCGNGRLTEHKADLLQEWSIIGVDLFPPDKSAHDNVTYIRGDVVRTDIPERSVDVVTADWSVVNDLLSHQQQEAFFIGVAKMLKVGGVFKFDVPHLEGGEGSWAEAADEHKRKNPEERLGAVSIEFPHATKKFHIYPRPELTYLLEQAGFRVDKEVEWTTGAGKPRLTFEAVREDKITPAQVAYR